MASDRHHQTTPTTSSLRRAGAGRRRGRATAEGGHDRRRLQGARAGVPGHLDLQDPLPRGPEAAHAAPHAGRLPALHPERRRAAAHDPAPAARRVPAAAGDPPGARRRPRASGDVDRRRAERRGRACAGARASACARRPGALYSLEDVVEETGADAKLVRELEEFGVIKGELRGGVRYFDETEREIVRAVSELARYGVGGRNLRVFRTSADREAQLLQRSSRRRCARATRSGARRRSRRSRTSPSVTTHLKHLLLIRDLRKIVDADARCRRTRACRCRAVCGRSSATSRTSRRPGIVFKDITPLLPDPRALDAAVQRPRRVRAPAERSTSWSPPRRAGSSSAPRSRGSSAPASCSARKPGKLPYETVSAEYLLEYGIDALELHADALGAGARVLVHDDLLATGGTAAGAVRARREPRRRGRRAAPS